jgi:hypothetical protein
MKGAPLSFEARFDGIRVVQARAAGARQSVGSAESLGSLEAIRHETVGSVKMSAWPRAKAFCELPMQPMQLDSRKPRRKRQTTGRKQESKSNNWSQCQG